MASVNIKVTVSAIQPLVNTGIVLKAGMNVSFRASEHQRWTENPDLGEESWVSPNGHSNAVADGNYIVPGQPRGSLVGVIYGTQADDRKGVQKFFIGTNHEEAIQYGGFLHLSINDDLPQGDGNGFEDNDGAIIVTVTLKDAE